jgi:choloylglycine hydrolase
MCTNISIPRKTKDEPLITARTLDFGKQIPTTLKFMPRQQSFPKVALPDEIKWKNKYGFLGMAANLYHIPSISYIDGMNEVGLSAAALWLPGSDYPKARPGTPVLYNISLVSYVLGNFRDVDEVAEALTRITVIEANKSKVSLTHPPLHFIITDAQGKHLVVEFMNGEMQTYRSKSGVLTNAPSYDWHLTNLSNYENLSVNNNPSNWWGQEINGSGQIGAPGDATPPSRFIRAEFLDQTAFQPANLQENVGVHLQILQTLVVPHGTVLNSDSEAEADYTQWSIVRDHSNRSVYFCTDFNNTLYGIHLDKLNFNSREPRQIDIVQPNWYFDISDCFRDS